MIHDVNYFVFLIKTKPSLRSFMHNLLLIIGYFQIMILLLRNRVRRRYLSISVAFLNPYSTLGISPGASKKEVKNAYRKKAKECHPDLHPGDEKKAAEFIKVQEAYESIQNGTASSAGGSSESTSQRMRQQKSWADRGFGSEQKQGFDFEYNYRQRMKARAEWERGWFL
jgi:DnaJ-class molecular chaperone